MIHFHFLDPFPYLKKQLFPFFPDTLIGWAYFETLPKGGRWHSWTAISHMWSAATRSLGFFPNDDCQSSVSLLF